MSVRGQPGADSGDFLGGQGGGCFPEHLHEPIDFDGESGVSDIASHVVFLWGAEGIDDGFARGVEHDDEGIAGVLAAEGRHEVFCAGTVGVEFVAWVLPDIEPGHDEGFIHDGMDGGVFKEALEELAGAAPGGAEGEEDVFVVGGSGGLGLRHDVVCAG